MTHESETPAHDPDIARATWVIGVAAALVFGMALGVAVGDVAAPAACAPAGAIVGTPAGP
ncbi:hypothetical protein [Rhodococcus gannanensis]|uniref:Uncharacterized protein n=1 Tax=Rhodococcus gannanensis TaxID=1960308 RepID=A0ABW4P1A5_9NOCA